MNSEVKKLWIDALESGEYQQCPSKLRLNLESGKSAYCCLGVLCDIHSKVTGLGKWDTFDMLGKSGYKYVVNGDNKDQSDEFLPKGVMDWAGINTDNGYIKNVNLSLTDYNDGGCGARVLDFCEIADVIKENF